MTTTPIRSGRSNPKRHGVRVSVRISSEMKAKLAALAEDGDLPENARRTVREFLAR